MHCYHIVYKTIHTLTGEYYIGIHSTNNLNDGYLGSGSRIKEYIKTQKEYLKREILEFCNCRVSLAIKEKDYVNETILSDSKCLNRQLGACPKIGVFKHSIDTKHKISNAHKGKTMSLEARQKMSKAKTGLTISDEQRKRISEANRGKNPWSKMSDETQIRLKNKIATEAKSRFSKKISVNGVIFDSADTAAITIGLNAFTLRYRARSKSAKFSNIFYVN